MILLYGSRLGLDHLSRGVGGTRAAARLTVVHVVGPRKGGRAKSFTRRRDLPTSSTCATMPTMSISSWTGRNDGRNRDHLGELRVPMQNIILNATVSCGEAVDVVCLPTSWFWLQPWW
jgi:hypothetical protein